MFRTERLILAHFGAAFIVFAAAIVLGPWQMAVRAGLNPPWSAPETYFASVTAHGTIMGYVMPTFFIMAFGYFVAVTALNRPLPSMALAWAGFWIMIVGTIMALATVFAGKATVLYTFYPPLTGSVFYYVGVALVVIGSWLWVALMIWAMADWKNDNPAKPVPLAMFGNVANAFLWLWTTAGVVAELLFQLIPASLGWTQTIDVGLARTLFGWTLHPIVYFWLLPAYIAFYTIAPQVAGGRLYSDLMGRISFLLLVLYSLPVGMHHLFADPEHGTGFKFLQAMLTALVTVPTLLTIFTVSASMEIAGRMRGGRGLFGWIAALPWDRPMVLATGLSFILLGFGGFGGFINMSYAMNMMIHNTSWVTAHFHLIYGGSVVIMYFAIAYEFWPKLVGREASSSGPMLIQLWSWAIGIIIITFPWHILGLFGQPRRVATFDYANPAIAYWQPWTIVSFVGGLIALASALLFFWNILTLFRGPAADREMHYAIAVYPPRHVPSALNGFALCNWLLLFLMIAAYGYPVAHFFFEKDYPAMVHRVDLKG
jgi:cytochrome c oxidase subunit I